jgi:hypothetical protein
MVSIRSRIGKLENELFEMEEAMRIEKSLFPQQKSPDTISSELPDNLIEFYKEIECFQLKWEANNLKNVDVPISGSINILKPDVVLSSWEGRIYISNPDYPDYEEPLKDFKIVDHFESEACVGYTQDERRMDFMEYLDIGDSETERLDLDFAGYMDMMLAARGYTYWQLVILHLRNQLSGREDAYDYGVDKFKTYMPQLFPDFKWEDFVALYERVRIK